MPCKAPDLHDDRAPIHIETVRCQRAAFLLDLVHDLVHNFLMEVNVHEAKTNFSKLLQRVILGDEIIIARAGVPIAKLVRFVAEKPKRELGKYRGQIWVADDFDGPLPDEILAGFLGEELTSAKRPPRGDAPVPAKRKKKR